MAVLLSLCMLLPLLPVAAFAADLTFGEGETAKTFTPVPEGRMSVRPVENTTMVTGDGTVTYTINATEGEDWVQNSGVGSNQAYTYVGLYVAMPEGAVSLKQNFEGNPENMDDVAADSDFLAGGKYQSWYPVAEGLGGDNGEAPFSLFWGGQEYTLLLEWYDEEGNLLENGREYVKVTRELGKDVAKVQVGELTYATFEAALEAALEANPTKPEVTLLANVEVSLELPAGVELAVNVKDDNGDWHTLTNTNADYVCVKGEETEEGRTDVYKLADTLVVGNPVENEGSVTTNVNGVLPADKTTVEVSVTTGAEGEQNGDVTSSAVTISANAMASIEDSTVKTVDIKTDVATLSVDSDAWSTMAKALSAVTLTVSVADERELDGGKLVYTLTAKDESGGDVFTESTGSITVSVVYGAGKENTPVVYYLSDKGAVQLNTVTYNKETGALSWSVNHFSEYEVADNAYEASVTTADGTTTTYATVGEALEAVAASGGTVNLLVDEATVDSLSLTIAGNVKIKGTGTINVTVKNEDEDDKNTSVFTIQNTGSLTLDGVKMVVNGVPNEGQGSDGTAFTLYGKADGVGSEVIVQNGGELWIQNINKGFIMGGPAPSTAKVTVESGVLNASGIDGNFSNGGEFVFNQAVVDIEAGVDKASEWVGHALSVHKLTATDSKITATATKYGLFTTDTDGEVKLLEGTTLEVKDSGSKFEDGKAAMTMAGGASLTVDSTSSLSVTGTNNKLHLDEAGTSVLLGTVEAEMNAVPYIYAVGFKANAADAQATIQELYGAMGAPEDVVAQIDDCDDNTMFVLFKGTGTADAYTLTVTKGGATIYTEKHPNATNGGVIYFTFEQDGGSHTKKPIASGTYTLKVEKGESKVVGTTAITLAKVSFETDSGDAPAAFYGAAGDTVTLPADKPTRTGFNFAGWKNVDGGEDAETFGAGKEYPMGSKDVTLTAQWNRRNSGGGAPSGGGGGSAATEYAVTMSTADNGSVAVSPKNAEKGDTVTVTVTPDEGYVLESLTVTDKDGDKVSTTKGEDGKYTFTMPGSTVTVKAVFAEEGTVSELPFEDVKVEQWFYEAVKYVYDNELMNGISATEFNPNGLLTRGTIAQVLFNLEGADADAAAVFDDVPADAWFADAVNWAAANNIVTGYGDGTFGPDNNITREQMAAILYRYAQFKGYDVSAKGDLTAFTDGDNVSEWATDALAWCVGAKLINGRDNGTVDATGTATRAEIAMIFMSFSENVVK